MPSSMPSPARRIGTTSGLGVASLVPSVGATGVTMLIGSVRTSLVASYASKVTSSSASRRNVGESVPLVPQDGELVRDERVVDDECLHEAPT